MVCFYNVDFDYVFGFVDVFYGFLDFINLSTFDEFLKKNLLIWDFISENVDKLLLDDELVFLGWSLSI